MTRQTLNNTASFWWPMCSVMHNLSGGECVASVYYHESGQEHLADLNCADGWNGLKRSKITNWMKKHKVVTGAMFPCLDNRKKAHDVPHDLQVPMSYKRVTVCVSVCVCVCVCLCVCV